MTENRGRCIVQPFGFHHGVNWFLVVVTLVLRFPPCVAGQVVSLHPPPPPGGYQFGTKIRISPTMTIVLVCLMSISFLVACFFVYVRQCVESRMPRSFTLGADEFGIGRRRTTRGIDPAVIDGFPAFMYSDVKGIKIGKGELECAVCLNEFEDEETLRLLPRCNHVFHRDCIDIWLSSHITCPVCRANLIPKPGESLPVTVLCQDPESELGHTTHSPDFHESQNHNLDRLVDDLLVPTQSPDLFNTIQTPNRNGPTRSTSRKVGVIGNFRRSYSTSESLVQPGENCEKFTLRLPEGVRNRLVSSGLSRTRSCVAFQRARSLRKGYRSSSGGTGRGRNFYYERFDQGWRSDRWEIMVTPPFFSGAGSVRSPPIVGGGEQSTTPKSLLKSVTSPLHLLFGSADNDKQRVNIADRSFDRPWLDGLV